MKKIILIGFVLALVGCNEENKRAALEQRFREAYPYNWQQKLLEYDIEQARIEGANKFFDDFGKGLRIGGIAAEKVNEGNRRNWEASRSQHNSMMQQQQLLEMQKQTQIMQEANQRQRMQDIDNGGMYLTPVHTIGRICDNGRLPSDINGVRAAIFVRSGL